VKVKLLPDGSVLFQTPLLDVAVWVVVFSVDPGDARAMADGFGVQTLRLPPGTRLCHLARQEHPHQLFLSGSGDGAGSRVGRLSASDRPNAIPPVGTERKGARRSLPSSPFTGPSECHIGDLGRSRRAPACSMPGR
jgi:hypothetical protein